MYIIKAKTSLNKDISTSFCTSQVLASINYSVTNTMSETIDLKAKRNVSDLFRSDTPLSPASILES